MRVKQQINTILLSLLFALCSMLLHAQQPAFANDIAAFKSQDSASFPATNSILFIGSSSFTKWTDVQSYFPGKRIINRGFGGSTLQDVIRYADDIIIPYQPKQVIIYCGENDLAADKNVDGAIVFNRFKQLYNIIRTKLPKTIITYISMKPSPSRRQLWGQIMVGNGMIRDFLEEQNDAYYIDVYYPMLSKGSATHASYFTSDSLHMNESGYKYWKYLIEPYLIRTK